MFEWRRSLPRLILVLMLLPVYVLAAVPSASDIPSYVIEQHKKAARDDHSTPFTFVGTLESISKNPYRGIDGELYGMRIKVQKMLIGSYDSDIVEIGITDRNNPPLTMNKKYYITVGWGSHGLYIGGISDFK